MENLMGNKPWIQKNKGILNDNGKILNEDEKEFFFYNSKTGNKTKKFKINENIIELIKHEDGSSGLDLSNYALGSFDELKKMIKLGSHYFVSAFMLASVLTVINIFGFVRLYDLIGFFKDMPNVKYMASFLLSLTLEYMILYSGLTGMGDMFENSKKASKIMGFMAFIPFMVDKAIQSIQGSTNLLSKTFLENFFIGIVFTGMGMIFAARIPDYISEAVGKIREIYFYKTVNE